MELYIVQRINGRINSLVQQPLNSEREIVVYVLTEPFPVQNELDDSRMDGGREETWRSYIKSMKKTSNIRKVQQ